MQICLLMYGWANNYPQKQMAQEAGIAQTSYATLVDWCNFFRELCEEYLEEHPMEIGGLNEDGTAKEVEIDETLYFHR